MNPSRVVTMVHSSDSPGPLRGARVAITRSGKAARTTLAIIEDLGGEPVVLPLTRTVAVDLVPPDGSGIDRAVPDVHAHDWWLFTSANGVRYFLDRLDPATPAPGSASVRIACVGQATARALKARGLDADLVPERGGGAALASALCHELGDRVRGIRILFPRAREGREEAADALRDAGAQVTVLPVYQTAVASTLGPDNAALARDLQALRRGEIHAIGFFAPSQVQALFELLGDSTHDALRTCALIAAIGDTTRAALTRRGVDVHVVPPRPSADDLVRALAEAWRARANRAAAAVHENDSKEG